jgi:hypothetical protein
VYPGRATPRAVEELDAAGAPACCPYNDLGGGIWRYSLQSPWKKLALRYSPPRRATQERYHEYLRKLTPDSAGQLGEENRSITERARIMAATKAEGVKRKGLSMASPTPRLQKWKRNGIVEAIQAVGLDPREFDLEDSDAEFRIKHRWSESCFIVGGDAAHYVGSYIVGDAAAWPYDAYSWQAVMTRVSGWLAQVKRDLETPDLWAELQSEAKLLEVASDEVTENTPFTPGEQEEIAERLRELAEYARHKYSLSEAQMRVLNAKLDYLAAAAGRLGRTDWRSVCAGVMLSFVVSSAFPPEFTRQMILTLVRAIGHLYGFPELPSG